MKQNITTKQLNELSLTAEVKLSGWTLKRGYGNLLSIGLMIEFLKEKREGKTWWSGLIVSYDGTEHTFAEYIGELCDDLWEDVKEVLEK